MRDLVPHSRIRLLARESTRATPSCLTRRIENQNDMLREVSSTRVAGRLSRSGTDSRQRSGIDKAQRPVAQHPDRKLSEPSRWEHTLHCHNHPVRKGWPGNRQHHCTLRRKAGIRRRHHRHRRRASQTCAPGSRSSRNSTRGERDQTRELQIAS